MSDIIKLLPDSVANQIAAGEVIQRPASVIKELVENAIDAGATSIKIILKDAGKTLIQVIDNGMGMSETDARLAFERHSTSKIRDAKDLFSLHTMGFRGEALASIAAISQVELRTMKRGAEMGTKICISASEFESQEADFCPEGCNFMIKNIFFNVPARRKFLKSPQVELSNIVREFEKLALVNHTTEFLLVNNDNTLHQLMAGDSFKQRITSLFSRSMDQQLIPIETETSLIKINGYVCRPENARKRNALQYFFVNGRYMRHPYFHKAVLSCYDQLIPSDTQPNYFLNFEVAPDSIDVNIHPTKAEIKFENEQLIWQIIFAAVKEALGKFSAVPSIDFDTEGLIEFPTEMGTENDNLTIPTTNIDPTYNPFNERRTTTPPSTHRVVERSAFNSDDNFMKQRTDDNLNNWDTLFKNFEQKRQDSIEEIRPDDNIAVEGSKFNFKETEDTKDELPQVGNTYSQINNKYILTFDKSGIILIDQHRAHIRVLYEKLIESKKGQIVESQKVMFPEVMNLTSSQTLILEELQEEMESLGFEISFLGDNSWAINAVPLCLKELDIKDFLNELIDSVNNGGNSLSDKLTEIIATTSAESAAIRYGKYLNEDEMKALVADLYKTKSPKYTPNGKVVIKVLSLDEINKMFY